MNKTDEFIVDVAALLFKRGCTIRFVSSRLKIAKETATRIQRSVKLEQVLVNGSTRVNTGRDRFGNVTYYNSSEIRPSYLKQQYIKVKNIRVKTP